MPVIRDILSAPGPSPFGSFSVADEAEGLTPAQSLLSIWQAEGWDVPMLGLFNDDQLTVNGSNEITLAGNQGDQGLAGMSQWLGPPFPLPLPTYDATGINGMPAIKFDDSGGRKILATPDFDATGYNAACLFVIARDTDTAPAQVVGFGEEHVDYDAGSLRLFVNTLVEWVSTIFEDSSGATAIANATSQSLSAAAVVTSTIDITAPIPEATIRMNGVELADSVTDVTTGNLGDLPIIAGGRPSSSASSWGTGWISAIVLVMRPDTLASPIPAGAVSATEVILANFRGL